MKTILIVDDNEDIHKLLVATLEKFFDKKRVQHTLAHSGNEAWSILSNKAFDLIICDLQMKNGDGIFLIDQMKMNGISSPLILFTSSPENAPNVDGNILKTIVKKGDILGIIEAIEKFSELKRK